MSEQQFPPGWYPDPDQPSAKRWWNGEAWAETNETASRREPNLGGPPRAMGWYDDPWGESDKRWWDGKEWSHRTRTHREKEKASKRTSIIVFTVLGLLVAPFVLMAFVVSESDPSSSGLTGSVACARTAELVRDADLMSDAEIRAALQDIEERAYGTPVHAEARAALAAATARDLDEFGDAIRRLNSACAARR